ncbi:hypothetical protein N7G274_000284 [Stereocaulon virgatum]|uniref:Cytochrome P450 n=1 Tax=Stereocaulon virgatum TaxID=373712 RepID=A0ABR4ARP7_9LECA
MASQPRLPVLPHGSPTTLSGLAETFSFHSSPEAFITSRVLAFQSSHPDLADSRTPIRAKVLNRNIAVISSYDHAEQLLCEEHLAASLSAGKAYDDLMAPFFPPPNILLADPPAHQPMKHAWMAKMASMPDEIRPLIQETALLYFKEFKSGSTIDLYESMKELSWQLILGVFMSAPSERQKAQKDQAEIESLHEDLLRGQFSLFPVGINLGVWRSPRARGLAARKKLQQLLKERVQKGMAGCPFTTQGETDEDDVANHLLLFTSSLAVKSLASLLTAVMLNLYISPNSAGIRSSQSPASRILSLENTSNRDELLKSIILETERLSPPVVGIMRRTVQDINLFSNHEATQDIIIPKGWDVWLYFVGAARDRASFGDTADLFLPERFYGLVEGTASEKKGFAFGAGAKSCLGENLIRHIVTNVAATCLDMGSAPKTRIELQCDAADIPKGVQGWLGWEKNVTPEEWAKDMKQLPTQRPVKGLMVKLIHGIER